MVLLLWVGFLLLLYKVLRSDDAHEYNADIQSLAA